MSKDVCIACSLFKFLTIIVCFFLLDFSISAQEADQVQTDEVTLQQVEAHTQGEVISATIATDTVEEQLRIIQFIEGTIERQLYWFNISVAVIGALVVSWGAIVSWAFTRWFWNTQNSIKENISIYVTQELQKNSSAKATYAELVASLSDEHTRHQQHLKALTDLREFDCRNADNKDDPSFSYTEAQRLSEDGQLTRENRRIVLGHLQNLIDHCMFGIFDPDTLFNASVVADRLDFHEEAIKLATLCNHYKPIASHSMLLADLQNTFGMEFKFSDDKIDRIPKSPQKVREMACRQAIIEILKTPREQCEIIYSRASNIAVREQEIGQISKFIRAIETSQSAKDRSVELKALGFTTQIDRALTSYGYVTLADFYAMQGDVEWESKYWENVQAALTLLSTESRMVTWYVPSMRQLQKTADHLGVEEKMASMTSNLGIDLSPSSAPSREK